MRLHNSGSSEQKKWRSYFSSGYFKCIHGYQQKSKKRRGEKDFSKVDIIQCSISIIIKI